MKDGGMCEKFTGEVLTSDSENSVIEFRTVTDIEQ